MHNINLKAYLANIGMTMTEFCNKIECNRSYMSQVSSGKTLPGRRLAKEISNATGGIINLQTKTKKSQKNQCENNHDND